MQSLTCQSEWKSWKFPVFNMWKNSDMGHIKILLARIA